MRRSLGGLLAVNDFFEAHGGLDQLRLTTAIRMDLYHGGALWKAKRRSWPEITSRATARPVDQTIEQTFLNAAVSRSISESAHVALYCKTGDLDQNIFKPRSWFSGHTLETPWWDLQSVYFSGCLVWNTVCLPIALTAPGVRFEERPGNVLDGERIRRLRVTFPKEMAMLSRVQTLTLDLDGSLRHVELDLEMVGKAPCILSVEGYCRVGGLRLPVTSSISSGKGGGSAPLLSAIYSNLEVEMPHRGLASSGSPLRSQERAVELPMAI